MEEMSFFNLIIGGATELFDYARTICFIFIVSNYINELKNYIKYCKIGKKELFETNCYIYGSDSKI